MFRFTVPCPHNTAWIKCQLTAWFLLQREQFLPIQYMFFNVDNNGDIQVTTNTEEDRDKYTYNIKRKIQQLLQCTVHTYTYPVPVIPPIDGRIYRCNRIDILPAYLRQYLTFKFNAAENQLTISHPEPFTNEDHLRIYQFLTFEIEPVYHFHQHHTIRLLQDTIVQTYHQQFMTELMASPEFKEGIVPYTLHRTGVLSHPTSFYYVHADLLRQWASYYLQQSFKGLRTQLQFGQYYIVPPRPGPLEVHFEVYGTVINQPTAAHIFEIWININTIPQQCYPETKDYSVVDCCQIVLPGEMIILPLQLKRAPIHLNPTEDTTYKWLQCFFIVNGIDTDVNYTKMKERKLPKVFNDIYPSMYPTGALPSALHRLAQDVTPAYLDYFGRVPKYIFNTETIHEQPFNDIPYRIHIKP